MEKQKISVIIPVYNTVDYLGECLESVTGQTYQNLEILILDDHSRDGSLEVALEWAKKDARIRVIQRERDGVAAARNEGIARTDGAYVTFVDADDKIEKRMLERLAEELEQSDSDMAMCGFKSWHGEVIPEEDTAPVSWRRTDRETYVKEYLLQGNTRCWSILYRRACASHAGFRKGMTIGEDMLFLVDLLPAVSQVSITGYPGYFYRINEQGAMKRAFRPSYMDQITCWQEAGKLLAQAYPETEARVQAILAVSAMLTAGKLAALPFGQQKTYREYTAICRKTVREALRTEGARRELDRGYRIKTALFVRMPRLYLVLYHYWKQK